MAFRKAEKFDDDRVFETIRRCLNLLAFGSKGEQAFFVAALGQRF